MEEYILENYDHIMEMNDYTFYIDFVTYEMGKLISGKIKQKKIIYTSTTEKF